MIVDAPPDSGERIDHDDGDDDSGDNLGLEDDEDDEEKKRTDNNAEEDIDETQNVTIKISKNNKAEGENFRDGVNEMVDDEAHMAQKTEYHLQYRPKFNQVRSDEYAGLGSGSRARKQMMPITSLASVLKKERTSDNSLLWSQSSQGGNGSSRASGTFNQLTKELLL